MVGRGRRLVVALSVLGALVGVVGAGEGVAAAADRPATVLQFRGRIATATFTDCDPTDPVGTECTAWDVAAFRRVLSANGDRVLDVVLSVVIFDVTIGAGGQVTVEYRSEGFALDADVTVPPDVRGAHAEGTVDLFVCVPPVEEGEPPVCDPTGEELTVVADWTAIGRGERYRDRIRDFEPGAMFMGNFWGRVRPASAQAVIDGDTVAVVQPPYADPPMLAADFSAELCLACGFPPPL